VTIIDIARRCGLEEITNAVIERDIRSFELRLANAQARLANLPTGWLELKKHRWREKEKVRINDDIRHIKGLIRIAKKGLKLEGASN
jgi:hypothetical protein